PGKRIRQAPHTQHSGGREAARPQLRRHELRGEPRPRGQRVRAAADDDSRHDGLPLPHRLSSFFTAATIAATIPSSAGRHPVGLGFAGPTETRVPIVTAPLCGTFSSKTPSASLLSPPPVSSYVSSCAGSSWVPT